ncbi:MAG: hypothetical protein AAF589_06505 [Planctomycetota bacterium]
MDASETLIDAVALDRGAADVLLANLATRLRAERRWHELLEVQLSQARLAHGLDVDATSSAGAEPATRHALENEYAAACEEAGRGLLADGAWRDAWFYLNTAGKQAIMREALAGATPEEEQADELIEIALHEGAAPAVGLRWMLERYGTCNSVTNLEGVGPHLPVDDLVECAQTLADHLYTELLASVRDHIARQEGNPPNEAPLPELLDGRPWLFEHEASHVDASHLAATVRMARVLTGADAIETAWRLADYGARLHPSLHYPDAPPFDELYPAHARFFAAQLGRDVEEAVAYFRRHAEQTDAESEGLAPVETLLVLLARTGRHQEALREHGRLVPEGVPLSPYAPTLLDLARESGDWAGYETITRQRCDVVGFARGRAVQRGEG